MHTCAFADLNLQQLHADLTAIFGDRSIVNQRRYIVFVNIMYFICRARKAFDRVAAGDIKKFIHANHPIDCCDMWCVY